MNGFFAQRYYFKEGGTFQQHSFKTVSLLSDFIKKSFANARERSRPVVGLKTTKGRLKRLNVYCAAVTVYSCD